MLGDPLEASSAWVRGNPVSGSIGGLHKWKLSVYVGGLLKTNGEASRNNQTGDHIKNSHHISR